MFSLVFGYSFFNRLINRYMELNFPHDIWDGTNNIYVTPDLNPINIYQLSFKKNLSAHLKDER